MEFYLLSLLTLLYTDGYKIPIKKLKIILVVLQVSAIT
jgi:hypothetical protein